MKRARIDIRTVAGRVRTPWAMLSTAWSVLLFPKERVTFQFAMDGSEIDLSGETVADSAKIALAAGLLVIHGSVTLSVLDRR